MATDLEKLVVQLSADFKSFEKSLARANGVTNKQFNAIERRARQMNKNLDGIFARSFKGLAAPMAGIGAALGTAELIKLADTWSDLTSRVNIAAGSMETGADVMERLGEMARRTYSSLEQTVESYVANSTALKELGYSTNQQLDYTEALNNALVISAAKGQRAAQIQDALAKAMAGGKLSGQELNTVIQSGGRVAEALAKGLGVGVNELRALGAAGKITSRDVFKALTSQMETLRKEAESMPATISDGIQLLQNAMLEYVGNADQATGISAKISEALVTMADNFDTTADAGLRLVAVFAAGLLGRSIANMVRTLGLGSAALVNFTKSLAAARTMGSLATSFGGLAAAAGPAGIVIGAGLATALVVAQVSAQATEERTARLNVEFERLGLRGKQAAEGVDEAAEALEATAAEARVQILKDINHELDRMRGGGSMSPFANWFGDAKEDAKELGAIIRQAGNALVGSGSADSASYQQIMQISAAVRDSKMGIEDAIAASQQLQQVDLSEPVRKLNTELIASLQHFGNLRSAEFASGQTAEFDELIAAAVRLTDQYDLLYTREVVDPKQLTQIDDIRERLKLGGEAAEQALRDLMTFANANPDFAGLADTLNPLIERLNLVAQRAREALAAVTGSSGVSAKDIEAYQQYGASRVAGRAVDESSAAYIREAERRAKLGKDQLALETEIARVREQSLKDGEMLTEAQIKQIAKINLAGNKTRSDEGKKPKQDRDAKAYENLTQRIKEQTAALLAENAALATVNPLLDDHGRAVTEATMAQDMLTAAKKAGVAGASEFNDIQQLLKGDFEQMSPAARELAESIRLLVSGYADAEVAGKQLSDANDKLKKSAEEFRDFGKDMMSGFISDLRQGKSAAEALENALGKVVDKLLDMALSSLFSGFNPLKLFGLKDGGPVRGYAGGGKVRGRGGPRDDKILARLSNGEFVVNAKATAQNRDLLEAINSGRMPRLADGGLVSGMPSMPRLPTPANHSKSGSTYAPVYHIDARGADAQAVARLEAGLKERDRKFGSMVDSRTDRRNVRRDRA